MSAKLRSTAATTGEEGEPNATAAAAAQPFASALAASVVGAAAHNADVGNPDPFARIDASTESPPSSVPKRLSTERSNEMYEGHRQTQVCAKAALLDSSSIRLER